MTSGTDHLMSKGAATSLSLSRSFAIFVSSKLHMIPRRRHLDLTFIGAWFNAATAALSL